MSAGTYWPRYSQGEKDKIVSDYLSGKSVSAIALGRGVNVNAISRLLKRLGTPMRTHSEATRKLRFDERFFRVVDSEEKAYWLGFIAADGCVTERSRICLALAVADREHLEKFRVAIGSQHAITVFSNDKSFSSGQMASVAVRSRAMEEDLGRLGVVRRKGNLGEPSTVDGELERHYWRGVFDGDGGVWPEGDRWCMSLVGNRAMVEGFARFARKHCASKATVRPAKNIFRYDIANIQAALVLRAMYDGCSVALDRKMACVEQVIRRYPVTTKLGLLKPISAVMVFA